MIQHDTIRKRTHVRRGVMKRIRGYKYRAYPNSIQQEFFSRTFGSCRF
ncbi:MAG: helix-turn-helix domain-containing protein, partial [Firmicutes bacterium]|nr:helix-turn-helix domain-containing protein [Bacillota bacterium]